MPDIYLRRERTTGERHSAAFPNAATLLLNHLLGGRGGRGLWPPF
jgi:hypothetical protein